MKDCNAIGIHNTTRISLMIYSQLLISCGLRWSIFRQRLDSHDRQRKQSYSNCFFCLLLLIALTTGCQESIDTSNPSETWTRLTDEHPLDVTSVLVKNCKIDGIEHQPADSQVTCARGQKIVVSGELFAAELGLTGLNASYKERSDNGVVRQVNMTSQQDHPLIMMLTVHGKPDVKKDSDVVASSTVELSRPEKPVEARLREMPIEFQADFDAPKTRGLYVVDLRLLSLKQIGPPVPGRQTPKRDTMPVWRFPIVVE